MFKVENLADGNCMYYAYSMSLMYFLRFESDPKITKAVFDKLNISAKDRLLLENILTASVGRDFEPLKRVKGIYVREGESYEIQRILGRATRELSATRVRQEFVGDPAVAPPPTIGSPPNAVYSHLFTSAHYGIEHRFLKLLQSTNPDISSLITNKFDNPTFTEAEIYRVSGIDKALADFTAGHMDDVVKEFNKRWPEKIKAEQEKRDKLSPPKVLNAGDITFYKAQILDSVIKDKTIVFFQEKNSAQLDNVMAYINTNLSWAAEETLMALHRAITGERQTRRNLPPPRDLIDISVDTPINLVIWRNYKPVYQLVDSSGQPMHVVPHMVINNIPGHWNTMVPPNIWSPEKPDLKKEKEDEDLSTATTDLDDDLSSTAASSTSTAASSTSTASSVTDADDPDSEVDTDDWTDLGADSYSSTDKPADDPMDKVNALFNSYASKIKDGVTPLFADLNRKIASIDKRDSAGYPRAKQLHRDLIAAKTIYIDALKAAKKESLAHAKDMGSTELAAAFSANCDKAGLLFVGTCTSLIGGAKPALQKDLGWGDYLKNLMKQIANFFIRKVTSNPNSLFTLKQSDSVVAAEKAALDLNTLVLTKGP